MTGANETAFLLNVAPEAVTNGATPLKIVEMGVTNVSYDCVRIVLASDVAELVRRSFGGLGSICNGHLALCIGTDLSAPRSE